jgi:hypothetical protein
MSLVSLDSLAPGMELAADVFDKSGRLLLGAGVVVEAKHLFIFRTWGVVEVDIVGEGEVAANALPGDITPEEMEQAKGLLLPLFCHADIEHPATGELFRLAAIRKAKHARR